MTTFELEAVGGPWARRLATRRALIDELAWNDLAKDADEAELARARLVWTQSAFSEIASAAAFAQIASALLAASAPIDLVAACGDFIADEIIHAELSARVANAIGGAVALDVDLGKLAKPATEHASPLLRAAELVLRTSCIGEALTVPMLKRARQEASSPVIRAVLTRIVADESAHAELGDWFFDWADPRLESSDRAHLETVARDALASFAPVFANPCMGQTSLGVMDCATFDATFALAVERWVVRPLAARGIDAR